MYCIISFSEHKYLLVIYDTWTSDNNITCEMSTLIAERLFVYVAYHLLYSERTSSFLLTSFGDVIKLLPAPYVFRCWPKVVSKNELVPVTRKMYAHRVTIVVVRSRLESIHDLNATVWSVILL